MLSDILGGPQKLPAACGVSAGSPSATSPASQQAPAPQRKKRSRDAEACVPARCSRPRVEDAQGQQSSLPSQPGAQAPASQQSPAQVRQKRSCDTQALMPERCSRPRVGSPQGLHGPVPSEEGAPAAAPGRILVFALPLPPRPGSQAWTEWLRGNLDSDDEGSRSRSRSRSPRRQQVAEIRTPRGDEEFPGVEAKGNEDEVSSYISLSANIPGHEAHVGERAALVREWDSISLEPCNGRQPEAEVMVGDVEVAAAPDVCGVGRVSQGSSEEGLPACDLHAQTSTTWTEDPALMQSEDGSWEPEAVAGDILPAEPSSTSDSSQRREAMEKFKELIRCDFERWMHEEEFSPWQAALIAFWRLQGRAIDHELLRRGLPV